MAFTTEINSALNHPAYLFVGSEDKTLERVINFLQTVFCKNNNCSVCIDCRKINEHQHESIRWLYPDKQYALDDLNIIFSTIAFALNSDQHFFFIIQKADLLTSNCANALLKSLEEPPTGYHFILLAQRAEFILPTIKSRCLIQFQQSDVIAPSSTFLSFFTTTTFQDPMAFSKELDALNPSEWDTLALLDQLLAHWSNLYKKSLLEKNNKKIEQSACMIAHLKKSFTQPPMPGSSKLFWKNLFLHIKEI